MFRYILFLLLINTELSAQFAPPAGQPGSTALHKDSAQWAGWASYCQVQRGWQDISQPGLGPASSGSPADALGEVMEGGVLSLGDGGIATLQFDQAIKNGPGPDFAVFENSFSDDFLELAFVEVSSDGQRFVRFPAISNTDSSQQAGSFGLLDASQLYNLAGKYRAGYGTPFDLEELVDSAGLDVNAITHVRVVDVVGCLQPAYASYDSRGIPINDPWATPFPSSGFDLDGVGALYFNDPAAIVHNNNKTFKTFPNPVQNGGFTIQITNNQLHHAYQIYNLQGQVIQQGVLNSSHSWVNTQHWPKGCYLVQIDKVLEKIIIH